jgi:hypothetical protein
MDLALLVLYNLGAAAVALVGLIVERRGRTKLGLALLLTAFLLLLNLLVGGVILFVPFILALYGIVLGLPILGIWLFVRWIRRGHGSAGL